MIRAFAITLVVLSVFAAPGAAAGGVSVSTDRTEVSTSLGRNFSFTTRVENGDSTPTAPLVAQLDVLSLRPGTYVDPEDWSARRTVYLGTIPARGTRSVTWTVKAVNSGQIGVFVAVLPQSGSGAPAASPTIRVDIAKRRTLNSGGILPLALGVPALLGLLAVGVRLRRRSR